MCVCVWIFTEYSSSTVYKKPSDVIGGSKLILDWNADFLHTDCCGESHQLHVTLNRKTIKKMDGSK